MAPKAADKDTPTRLPDPVCPDVMVPASPFAAVPVIAIETFGVVAPGDTAADIPVTPKACMPMTDPEDVDVTAESPVSNS
jgi:hypothetical protein